MVSIETYYLIDYENVHSDGLSGCEKLKSTDHIIIFFTRNAKNIDMSIIANHGQATIDMIEIPVGKQSVDMHIGSYIGFLVGKNGSNINLCVVSKDKGYDGVLDFWSKKVRISTKRITQIKEQENAVAESNNQAKEPEIKVQVANNPTKSNDKTTVNAEIQNILLAGGFQKDVVIFVAGTVVKNINVKNKKQQIYRAIISKYGQNKGLKVYNQIKKYI